MCHRECDAVEVGDSMKLIEPMLMIVNSASPEPQNIILQ
jgi:hypothetical protein